MSRIALQIPMMPAYCLPQEIKGLLLVSWVTLLGFLGSLDALSLDGLMDLIKAVIL